MGGYLTPNNATREMKDALSRTEIGKVTPHELRHTFISLMLNDLECPIHIVQELVGHSKKGVTGGYSKSNIAQKRKWMDRYWKSISDNYENSDHADTTEQLA